MEDFVLVDIAGQPLFDLVLWNMYDQAIGDLLRTNNAVEGWHRRFQANVRAYQPNFWKFIDILKREQSLNHVNISQARAGHQPEPQRRRYQDSNRRIKNIVQDYHNRVGSKTTDERGDEWRRVHTSGYCTGDEYIRVPRGQEMSTYNRRRVHTSA